MFIHLIKQSQRCLWEGLSVIITIHGGNLPNKDNDASDNPCRETSKSYWNV